MGEQDLEISGWRPTDPKNNIWRDNQGNVHRGGKAKPYRLNTTTKEVFVNKKQINRPFQDVQVFLNLEKLYRQAKARLH